jgi:7-keto-8-aminopelargonate synthetase-like enzyme
MNAIRPTQLNTGTTPALTNSLVNFVKLQGKSVRERTLPFWNWTASRRQIDLWPYSRVALTPPAHTTTVATEHGTRNRVCINFGSQDYLGLAREPAVFAAAQAIIDEYGVHSAGSPALVGRTSQVLQLEAKLANQLKHESSLLYATGWAAGFGVVAGLVRASDTIVIDRLAHNCLAEGARHATQDVKHFSHNDLASLEEALSRARSRNASNGLFVVAESLYSMDSDSPNLNDMLRLVRKYDAILILDVAHDFGAMGRTGLGLLDTLTGDDWPDVIMGSFSKTFASNGGFVAADACVTNYLRYYSPSFTFSNGISPIQTAIISQAFDLVFSAEGCGRRQALMANVVQLRGEMERRGLTIAGTPSPIVPVFVGDEKTARLTSSHLEANGLLANLVEFPAVARGAARFRFQVMSSHSPAAIIEAADIMAKSREQALADLREMLAPT